MHADCFLYRTARSWGFTPYAICLGSSYFQRLLADNTLLQQSARSSTAYASYGRDSRDPRAAPAQPQAAAASSQQVNAHMSEIMMMFVDIPCRGSANLGSTSIIQ